MKVLLMSPINRTYVIMPSLGLGYSASVLRRAGHDVVILHCLQKNFNFSDFASYIRKNHFDVIGIQMFTFDITPVRRHIKIIKRLQPDAKIILGGYHPSGDPQGILNLFRDADYAFASEVEIAFPMLLKQLDKANPELSKVPNLVWRKKGKVIANKVKVIENLDNIPFPAWDLMDPRTYPKAPHGGFFKCHPTAPIIITRGCPMQCTFCAGKAVTTRNIRKRSISNVISEIKLLRDKYGVRDFLIEDENFTVHKSLVIDFCNAILSENLNIWWSCPSGVRLDTLDLDMLRLMEKSGCYSLSVGVEFGSQRIHDITKKHLTLEKIKEKVSLFKRVKIRTTGFFMFGIPGETKKEMVDTIKFAKSLDIDRAQFNNFMPLPGSELYNEMRKNGLKSFDYDHFFVHDVGYVPPGMTRKQMKNIQRRAYLEFYLRPRVLINIMRDVSSLEHFKRLVKRFIDSLS